MQNYFYVGSAAIREAALRHAPERTEVSSIRALLPPLKNGAAQAFTFVIDLDECLWIADRRSEHVACARGANVLAAGEVWFMRQRESVTVVDISNQSTGYCPKTESWNMVASVLKRLGIPAPEFYTAPFEFRRCPSCQTISIVKDGELTCAVCNSDLPAVWNF